VKITEWLTILIPVMIVAGGFLVKTYELQGRVDKIELNRSTEGKQALADLRSLEKRVYKIELQCQCAE